MTSDTTPSPRHMALDENAARDKVLNGLYYIHVQTQRRALRNMMILLAFALATLLLGAYDMHRRAQMQAEINRLTQEVQYWQGQAASRAAVHPYGALK